MILIALLTGGVAGWAIIGLMHREGMLAERSGVAVLVAAVAFFYPVFAATDGDTGAMILHITIFACFIFLAVRGYRRGMFLLAGGLIAHGIFDVGLAMIASPGPAWWPAFCAALDLVAGVSLLRLMQSGKVPR